jgi:hypothetical protein
MKESEYNGHNEICGSREKRKTPEYTINITHISVGTDCT